jgi:PD-(D/E)XK nuclease superfamily
MSFTDDLRNNGWSKPTQKNETLIRRFSTTGDILAFKRCQRQYGFFSVRGFSSATATQRYFGTLVHDVLDQVHRQYTTNPALPDQPELEALVQQAHDRLIRSGIRPYNARAQRELATKLIGRFLELIGPHFFPHVQQTEYHLQRALRTHTDRQYVLDGIVDVLSGAVAHDLELSFSTDEDDVEIAVPTRVRSSCAITNTRCRFTPNCTGSKPVIIRPEPCWFFWANWEMTNAIRMATNDAAITSNRCCTFSIRNANGSRRPCKIFTIPSN